MIEINQLIHSIPLLPSSERNDLLEPFSNFALKQPIKISGKINNVAAIQEILKDSVDVKSNSSQKHHAKQFEIGVDEVGRGPLYGSVVVSAVILPNMLSGKIEALPLINTSLGTLTDSKKLTETKRERLFPMITQQSLGYMIVDVPAAIIDELNILQATLTGMRIACEYLMIQMKQVIQNGYSNLDSLNKHNMDWLSYKLLIDGNKIPYFDWTELSKHGLGQDLGKQIFAEAWVKGDSRHTAIAAASVLSKVTRDRQVVQDALTHKGYGLEKHKGYPTKTHFEAIQRFGVLPEHRRSFKPIKQALGLI